MHTISDQIIYHWLRELHVVRSQYHVSALCGRTPGWFSSTRCQGRVMPSSAMRILVGHAEQQATQETDALNRERLRIVIARMRDECAKRELRQTKAKSSR